jgi:hypothetical protein
MGCSHGGLSGSSESSGVLGVKCSPSFRRKVKGAGTCVTPGGADRGDSETPKGDGEAGEVKENSGGRESTVGTLEVLPFLFTAGGDSTSVPAGLVKASLRTSLRCCAARVEGLAKRRRETPDSAAAGTEGAAVVKGLAVGGGGAANGTAGAVTGAAGAAQLVPGRAGAGATGRGTNAVLSFARAAPDGNRTGAVRGVLREDVRRSGRLGADGGAAG